MPIRPGWTGAKSCFSFASVLKTRSGMGSPFQGLEARRAQALFAPPPVTLYSEGSAVEDRLEVPFDVVLVDALRQRQLLDQQVAGGVEHLALAEAQVLVELEQVQVAQHLGDLEDRARLDLLHVLAVAAVPSGRIHRDILLTQDGINLDHGLLVDQVAQADRAHLVDGDEDFHPVFHDLEDVEGLPLTSDVLVLDTHDFADALPRVDGLVADLESLHRPEVLTRSGIERQ